MALEVLDDHGAEGFGDGTQRRELFVQNPHTDLNLGTPSFSIITTPSFSMITQTAVEVQNNPMFSYSYPAVWLEMALPSLIET
jgi:hypothetical protein